MLWVVYMSSRVYFVFSSHCRFWRRRGFSWMKKVDTQSASFFLTGSSSIKKRRKFSLLTVLMCTV